MTNTIKTNKFVMYSLLLPALLLLTSCATTPRYLSRDYVGKIKNIAVVTILEDDDLNVIDIGNIKSLAHSKQGAGMMFGALGVVLEAVIVEGVADIKVNSLIGGNITPIKESIADFDTKTILTNMLHTTFAEYMKTYRDGQNVIMLKPDNLTETAGGMKILNTQGSDYPDVLLKIEYKYGIGAYTEQKPLPALSAQISVVSIRDNKELMKDTITSYSCSDKNYTLSDYAENNGKIYRECFGELAANLGQRLASAYF